MENGKKVFFFTEENDYARGKKKRLHA